MVLPNTIGMPGVALTTYDYDKGTIITRYFDTEEEANEWILQPSKNKETKTQSE
jgi:hypothetical protein